MREATVFIPPELDEYLRLPPPRPRDRRLEDMAFRQCGIGSRTLRAAGGWLGFVALLALCLSIISWNTPLEMLLDSGWGEQTEGHIVGVRRVKDHTYRQGKYGPVRTIPVYELIIGFSDGDDRPAHTVNYTSGGPPLPGIDRNLKTGFRPVPVSVRYLRCDPTFAVAGDAARFYPSHSGFWFPFLLFLGGSFLLFCVRDDIRIKQNLLRRGRAADAVPALVVSFKEKHGIKYQAGLRLGPPEGGLSLDYTCLEKDKTAVEALLLCEAAGRPLRVVFQPGKKKRFMVLGAAPHAAPEEEAPPEP